MQKLIILSHIVNHGTCGALLDMSLDLQCSDIIAAVSYSQGLRKFENETDKNKINLPFNR